MMRSSMDASSYYDSEYGDESSVWEEYDPKLFFQEALHGVASQLQAQD